MSSFLKSLKENSGGVISGLIDNYFAVGEYPDEMVLKVGLNKERDSAFHPSSDAIPCARQIYLKRNHGKPEKIGAPLAKTFQIGHIMHAWLQYVISDELKLCTSDAIEREYRCTLEGDVCDTSVDWRTDPVIQNSIGWMRGYADLVPVEIPGKGEYLIDIKTSASYMFKAVPEDNATWEKYHAQCQLYMDWFNVDNAVVLYLNKDTPHGFKERIVKRDSAFVDQIYMKWLVVAEAERAGVAPVCDEECCN